MMHNLKRFSLQMVAGANLATILVMLLVGYSDRLNPIKHQVLANAGLVFPVFLIINFGFASKRKVLCCHLLAILFVMVL